MCWAGTRGSRSGRASGLLPGPPVGRPDVDPGAGLRVHPAAKRAPARKHEAVLAVLIDDGQLEFEVKRRSRYEFPHSLLVRRETSPIFDLDHEGRSGRPRARCPLCPQKQTFVVAFGMSAKCQKRTLGVGSIGG